MVISSKFTDFVQLVSQHKGALIVKIYFAVGIGGVIGSSVRYLISLLLHSNSFIGFPWATLFVNVTGAFLLSFILFHPTIKTKLAPAIFTALTTGVIGSYTTFSTITVEVVMLFHTNSFSSIIYLLLTIFVGLLASYLGYKFAHRLTVGGILK